MTIRKHSKIHHFHSNYFLTTFYHTNISVLSVKTVRVSPVWLQEHIWIQIVILNNTIWYKKKHKDQNKSGNIINHTFQGFNKRPQSLGQTKNYQKGLTTAKY